MLTSKSRELRLVMVALRKGLGLSGFAWVWRCLPVGKMYLRLLLRSQQGGDIYPQAAKAR